MAHRRGRKQIRRALCGQGRRGKTGVAGGQAHIGAYRRIRPETGRDSRTAGDGRIRAHTGRRRANGGQPGADGRRRTGAGYTLVFGVLKNVYFVLAMYTARV